ncbi:nitroreductase [Paenibacillus oryzae]|uniref:Putative NAD(P)H nitroreductase n=1 Tax=Paenibacillus oryzae TaxID=1844972 RepID=A0A1A5YJ81_9BACL|nr:nitroreductase [Paenibacillus oryzae]OBR65671.1 nitroreductase [Paenibacillus oryzae]
MSQSLPDVLTAIAERRSIGRFKNEPVERDVIIQLLQAAGWAPSHHNTQPWRFVVMTGEGRNKLGEGYADVALSEASGLSEEEVQEKRKKEIAKAFRAPVVIAAICSPADDPRAVAAEERAAAQAAVQNLLLAAHGLGLGAIWRSGAPMFHEAMKAAFELRSDEEIVAFIYLGHPDMKPLKAERADILEKTIWLD